MAASLYRRLNYSDPFGLCPPQDNNFTTCTGFWTVAGAAAGALLGGGAGVGGGPAAPVTVAAGALEGATLGARAGAVLDGIVWFGKQARAVEKASELVDNITGHINTVRGDPNADDANHHRGEIRGWVDRVEKYAQDMKGKTQEEWLRKAAEWRKQLQDITPR